jgi:GNAT superfamily N-acetyltransferase
MSLTLRPYRNEYDYFKIREFLCTTLLIHDRKQINWPLYRWDYWRWHVNANIFQFRLEENVFLWETDDNALAAVLHPDGRGEAFLQIHPRHRTAALVDEMLALAEKKFPAPAADGKNKLHLWAHERDEILKTALTARGYTQTDAAEHQRWQLLDHPLAEVPLAAGYTLRSLGSDAELPARSWASWRAFHPDEPDENYKGWDWYRNVQRAPIYRRDLDLVAVASDGEIAAFTTVWYDEATKTGAFEPVGTQPQHQRKGLAKALLTEGLRRLQKTGAVMAYVSSYEPAAHAAYASVGFKQFDLSGMWIKTCPASESLV